jgi:hypothetical protein
MSKNFNNGMREIPGWHPPAGTHASEERDARLRREADEQQRRNNENQRMVFAQEDARIEAERRTAAERKANEQRKKQTSNQQTRRGRESHKQSNSKSLKQLGRSTSGTKPQVFKRKFLNVATVVSVLCLFYCGILIGDRAGWTGGESAMMGGFLALFSRTSAYLIWYVMAIFVWLLVIGGAGWLLIQAAH